MSNWNIQWIIREIQIGWVKNIHSLWCVYRDTTANAKKIDDSYGASNLEKLWESPVLPRLEGSEGRCEEARGVGGGVVEPWHHQLKSKPPKEQTYRGVNTSFLMDEMVLKMYDMEYFSHMYIYIYIYIYMDNIWIMNINVWNYMDITIHIMDHEDHLGTICK